MHDKVNFPDNSSLSDVTLYRATRLLTERDVSQLIGLSQPTLSRHRRDGTGPAFVKLSPRRIAYRPEAIEEWLAANTLQANASAPEPAPTSATQ